MATPIEEGVSERSVSPSQIRNRRSAIDLSDPNLGSGVIERHHHSLIRAYLARNRIKDFSLYSFELDSNKQPNITRWEYRNLARPTWNILSNLHTTNEFKKQKRILHETLQKNKKQFVINGKISVDGTQQQPQFQIESLKTYFGRGSLEFENKFHFTNLDKLSIHPSASVVSWAVRSVNVNIMKVRFKQAETKISILFTFFMIGSNKADINFKFIIIYSYDVITPNKIYQLRRTIPSRSDGEATNDEDEEVVEEDEEETEEAEVVEEPIVPEVIEIQRAELPPQNTLSFDSESRGDDFSSSKDVVENIKKVESPIVPRRIIRPSLESLRKIYDPVSFANVPDKSNSGDDKPPELVMRHSKRYIPKDVEELLHKLGK